MTKAGNISPSTAGARTGLFPAIAYAALVA